MAPRGMGSLIGMPVVGNLVARLDPRKMVGTGLIVGAVTLFWLGQLNLNAGYWDIFWPQFLQGMGLSLIFVPLTTISMAPIARERMGYATSLYNLMRNLGGSISKKMIPRSLNNSMKATIEACRSTMPNIAAYARREAVTGSAPPAMNPARARASAA